MYMCAFILLPASDSCIQLLDYNYKHVLSDIKRDSQAELYIAMITYIITVEPQLFEPGYI